MTTNPTVSAQHVSSGNHASANTQAQHNLINPLDMTRTTPPSMTGSNSNVDMVAQMRDAACGASQLLKSLSHPDRLMLLCQLTQGEYCVSELEELVGLAQPSLSQQLGILRKENLVTTRRDGKQIYYAIASDDAMAVLQLLYQRFCPQP